MWLRAMITFLFFAAWVGQLAGGELNIENCGVNMALEEQKNFTSFIVGGNIAAPGAWPWICSVGFMETENWEHQCGGTLVTYRHVLTAGHCPVTFGFWKKDDIIKVRCGDYNLENSADDIGLQIRGVAHFEVHDGYKYSSPNYDISVLFLDSPLQATPYVRPICLENPNMQSVSDGTIVIGWGKDRNGDFGQKLKKATLQILDPEYCGSVLESIQGFGQDLFCATDQTGAGDGSCKGDSGGPIFAFNSIMLRYELKGLVNGGLTCGVFGNPDVYTSTIFDDIHSWIIEKIESKQVLESKCYGDQKCVTRSECPSVQNKYSLLRNLKVGSILRDKTVSELKSMVCDRKKRSFCCETVKEQKKEVISKDESFLPSPEQGECGENQATISQSIVGGKNAPPGEFPFSAGIRLIQDGVSWKEIFHGSGTLISYWYILTGATIVVPNIDFIAVEVVLGEWDVSTDLDCSTKYCLPETQTFTVNLDSVYIHPDYNYQGFPKINDIALMKLPRPAKLNLGVQLACLPLPNSEYTGETVDVVGWGQTAKAGKQATIQQHVTLATISKTLCQKLTPKTFPTVPKTIFCHDATAEEACSGDGGAGLFYTADQKKYVIGIISYGASNCGSSAIPGYNTKVSHYIDWIKNCVKGTCEGKRNFD